MVKPIPDGAATLSPHLVVADAARAIAFYIRVFGASERMRFKAANGAVMHAELAFGTSVLMLADAGSMAGLAAPTAAAPSPVTLALYVADVDQVVAQAVAAGATLTLPVTDRFYGDRSGSITDPFGYVWHVSTHVEDLTSEQISQRQATSAPPPGTTGPDRA